jgi:AcrR family transcriptional regulator
LNAAPRARRRAGPTRAERQAVTRAALLRAATRSICEHGMDGASIDRIAAEAGYTKGAFYANFASKEDMFLAMLDEHFAEELAHFEQLLDATDDAVDVARVAADDLLAFVYRDPQWPRLYQEFAVHAARNEAFRVRLAARHRQLRARMAELFARWVTALGIEPVLPYEDVAAMTMAMADGFILNRILDPQLDKGLYATMSEVFLRGLMAMSQEPQAQAQAGGER